MIRGMFTTMYVNILPKALNTDFQGLYETHYRDDTFVDVMPAGSQPETRSVRASNTLRIALHRPAGGKRLIITVVQDNLVKGASGQAVQNMNVMFGLPESTGLTQIAILP
jgi:N-acetyl-gamma-glutamyl-phosphate reductase